MSVIRVVRLVDIFEQPWKNGRGATRLIASGLGWRVSQATVASEGTFSVFEGCRRHSVVLAGDAVNLKTDRTSIVLDPHSVVEYSGSTEWKCQLGGRPATVLNVICDERIAEASLEKSTRHRIIPGEGTVVLLPVNCSATCVPNDGGIPIIVPPGHVFLCDEQTAGWTSTPDVCATAASYLLAILINPPRCVP